MRLRGSQEQERRVMVLPREVEHRQLTQLRQVQSQHHQWIPDEKEAQQERLRTVVRAFFFFFEML